MADTAVNPSDLYVVVAMSEPVVVQDASTIPAGSIIKVGPARRDNPAGRAIQVRSR